MKVIFISGAASWQELNRCEKKYARRPMRFVQQWWDYSMALALKKILEDDFFALSFPPISTFPSGKCLVYTSKPNSEDEFLNVDYLSVINLPFVKQKCLIRTIYRKILKILRKYPNEEIIILTHCVYLQSAVPSFKLRKKHKNLKVFTIVPDLPEHATAVGFKGHTLLQKMHRTYVKKNVELSKEFDGYICFSEPQMEFLNQEKPHIVMEGFMDTSMMDSIAPAEPAPNRIVYAGGLMYRYGIRELIDGFIQASIPGAELYIYGQGEAEEYIKGKEAYGIYYGGSVSREEVIAIEKSSFLLVNPRPTKDDYTRCSFPSKLMEYMASGTPVLTSRLGCIGEEYFDKLNFMEEVSPEGIAEALRECFSHKELLRQRAERAAQYIRTYKNADYQARVVVDFLSTQGGK